ncbi:MAG TPA: alpha/beta hydrolase domain-containing protein [Alphaproteobacteria bacterium]
MIRIAASLSVVALLAATEAADARVTRIEIQERTAFAGGATFGDTGAYEKIVGRFHGELDPSATLNTEIVDLDKAPRNARGKVEYSSDFFILKPLDMSQGNGALLYDVNNRGNKRALIQFNSGPAVNDPATAEDAGNGFLMRHGFTVVWSGWLADLPAANHALRLEVPRATAGGGRIEQTVWDEFLFNNKTTLTGKLSFPAVDRETATLLVRDRNADPPTTLARDQWEFVDADTIRLLPAGTPFTIGAIYQLVYRAADPPVAGIGFAATRDLIAFLRRETQDDAGTPNPLAASGRPGVSRALAHGTSQSGRYLRDFVYRGFNEDEANRIVFEGINPHIATGRLFLDFRFAQANRMMHIGHGFMYYGDASFPFAYENETDPFTGKSDGILARCTARNTCPRVIHTVSGIEYWQSGQSLITTDPGGQRDATLPANVRVYHIASTQHVEIATMPPGVCALPVNPVDRRPVLRALLLALDRWVTDGAEPPQSRYPRIADSTLVDMKGLGFPSIGITLPKGPSQKLRLDYGPDYREGIIGRVPPVELPDPYPVLVPKVDADGNDVAGVRLPDVAVPTATATGWAVRAAEAGGAGELCYLDGSYVPFARTKAERETRRDPRPSLEERYRDKADYAAKVQQAARGLQQQGYLLAEDVQRISERAGAAVW